MARPGKRLPAHRKGAPAARGPSRGRLLGGCHPKGPAGSGRDEDPVQVGRDVGRLVLVQDGGAVENVHVGAAGGGLTDLGGLKPFFVVDANDDPANFDGDNDKLAGRWRDAHALEILSGRIQESAGTFSVKSRVYFGELDTGFNSRFLSIELPIVDEEYDTTRDSHSVAILYALALDAMHRCQPENEVILLLSAAHERLSDLPAGMAGMELLRRKIQEYLVAPRLCSQEPE